MPPIKVGDVDRQSGKIVLRHTKNRSAHKLLLPKQALEIVERNRLDRKADTPVSSIRIGWAKERSWSRRLPVGVTFLLAGASLRKEGDFRE